jgi:chemotaxis protein histidine kinase CheA
MKIKSASLFGLCALLFALCNGAANAADYPVANTAGSNLTAYNSNFGTINNNQWNQLSNMRTAPAADFGNCNSVILRCATPKCGAGCTTMDIAYPIVSGCVNSNTECAKHGESLIQTIAAQMVANANEKAAAANAAAERAASDAAAAASAAQMQQMQSQMQQMQQQMSQQSAQQTAAVQQALEEQKKLAEQPAAAAAAAAQQAAAAAAPATNVANAVANGVSADILAREQASGQIMTQLENAQTSLNTLKKTMQTAFDYAGCDANGNNCAGPKRVKAFKQKANEFFDPYENVLDEVYDALIMAQSLGVDITDIYMMLNGSCNVWGKYFCSPDQTLRYASCMSGEDGCACGTGYTNYMDATGKNVRTKKTPCPPDASQKAKIIPISAGGCQLIQMLNNNDQIQQEWLYPMDETASGGGRVEVGCASEALDNSVLFRNRKKQATIDVETLQRIIDQDAPTRIPKEKDAEWLTHYCAVGDDDIYKLQTLVQNKSLTTTGLTRVCVTDTENEKNVAPVTMTAREISENCNPNQDFKTEEECKKIIYGSQTCYWLSPSNTWRINCPKEDTTKPSLQGCYKPVWSDGACECHDKQGEAPIIDYAITQSGCKI